ncbi:hypothetical protein YA0002_25185, partial [Pseudomonas cichorii]|uniref:hypothetical protein n=1 Tax=Pseudomonas cichorii TaxID=36746 RepID=UPI0018E5C4C1
SLSKLTKEEGTDVENRERLIAQAITSGGLSRHYFSMFESLSKNFVAEVKAAHPTPNAIKNLKIAIFEFNKNPEIAAKLSANNADSLIYSAYGLHKLYKKNFSSQPRK